LIKNVSELDFPGQAPNYDAFADNPITFDYGFIKLDYPEGKDYKTIQKLSIMISIYLVIIIQLMYLVIQLMVI